VRSTEEATRAFLQQFKTKEELVAHMKEVRRAGVRYSRLGREIERVIIAAGYRPPELQER
jgi:hypothetical protein